MMFAGAAYAQESGPEWTEIGDAGDLPGNSQKPVGVGPMITAINGALGGVDPNFSGPGDFQDVYEIEILTAGFFIEAVPLLDGDPSFDLSLWLFDASGLGIAGNLDKDPSGLANLAFPDDGMGVSHPAGHVFSCGFRCGQRADQRFAWQLHIRLRRRFFPSRSLAPMVPAHRLPVSGWEDAMGLSGKYRLELSGVGFVDVPVPGTAFGFVALLFARTSSYALTARFSRRAA